MSHSNRHQFAVLDKNSKPLSGQRLARVICKTPKDGILNPNLVQSLCISIPMISVDTIRENIDSLIPHIVSLVENTQSDIIAEMRKSTGCSEIGDDDIDIGSCIEYLEASAKGTRVSGEYLNEWLRDTYSLQASEFIAIALSFPSIPDEWSEAQTVVIEQKINVLFGMFSGYASGKYSPDIPKCKAMIRFCEYLGINGMDSRMSGYMNKTVKILDEKMNAISVDALGF